MPSNRIQTPEEKAAWAAYMREYRKRRKEGVVSKRDEPLQPTERQLEILRAYAHPDTGGSQKAVADALGISVSAVHNQLQRLMKRIGVKDPSQAVMKLWVTPHNGKTEEVPGSPGRDDPSPGEQRA